MTDAKRTRGLELWQDFQARKGLARTRAELVLWFAQGQDIENFLAQLPHLPAGFLQEIQQYAQDPVGRKELRDVLFKGTYPGLHKVRKVVGGVDLFCDGIGLLVGRKEQSPDSSANVVIVVLWTLLVASPWIVFSFLAWGFIGPVVWWRKIRLERRVKSALASLCEQKGFWQTKGVE